MEKWQEQLGSGESGEIEARVRRYDGVYHWFLIRMAPFRDESGKIIRWYGTSTDIENLKQTETKLRDDERELGVHPLGEPDGHRAHGPRERLSACQAGRAGIYSMYQSERAPSRHLRPHLAS